MVVKPRLDWAWEGWEVRVTLYGNAAELLLTLMFFLEDLLLDLEGFVLCEVIVIMAVGMVCLSFRFLLLALLCWPPFFFTFLGRSDPLKLLSSEEI